MHGYQGYPEYRDSGIEWVGNIPKHWDVYPVFAISREKEEKNSLGEETNVLSLSYGRIIRRNVEENFGLMPESFNTYQIVQPGDVILRLTDLQNDKRSLRVGLVKEKGIITSAYLCLKSGTKLTPEFLYALLHSYDTTKVFYGMGGGLRQSMKFADMRRMPFLTPPLEEQQAIIAYISHETAKIDRLIEKQQRLIELLKEKRQAVISHAVTKGLDPNVKMKDSGVEWLGQVPEHWEIKRVRHACLIDNNLRTPIDREIRAEIEGEYRYYGPTGVLNYIDRFNVDGEYFLLSEDGDHFLKFAEKPQTILVSGKFSVNNHAHLIRGMGGCSTPWACLFFEHRDLFPWIIKQGVGRYKLRKESLQEIPILVPPIEEQNSILHEISQLKHELDLIEKNVEKLVAFLYERRTALISSAVTGKIDVRHWRAETQTAA